MSVVVRMEMPKRCCECDMADGVTCMATGGTYGREVTKMTWIRRRPDWCPIICQLPEGHGRLVDMRDIEQMEVSASDKQDEYFVGWNDAIKICQTATTIVPAEAERREHEAD